MTEGLLASETPEEKAYFEGKGAVPEAPVEKTPAETEKPAETRAEEPAEEPEAGAEPEQPKEPDLHTVPYAALKEERQKRQKEREERLKLEGRLGLMEQEWHKSRDSAPEQPKELDPLAKLDRADKYIAERQQADQEQAARNDLVNRYQADAREFAKDTPDFNDAYQYAVSHRLQELQLLGHDPATAQQIVQSNELAIVHMALQQGRSPAQVVYEQAKLRGYAPKKAEAPKETAQQKLASVEKGQQASKSLSQAAGSPAKTNSLQALLDMSDEDFDKATKGKAWEKFWK